MDSIHHRMTKIKFSKDQIFLPIQQGNPLNSNWQSSNTVLIVDSYDEIEGK